MHLALQVSTDVIVSGANTLLLGTLFVKSNDHLEKLKQIGPLSLLQRVGFPVEE